MNKCLYKLPICGWNLTHILIFYLLSDIMENLIKNRIQSHIITFCIGCIWYLIEPIVYHHKAKVQNKRTNDLMVYDNVYVPRLDDLIFNTIGQIIHIQFH